MVVSLKSILRAKLNSRTAPTTIGAGGRAASRNRDVESTKPEQHCDAAERRRLAYPSAPAPAADRCVHHGAAHLRPLAYHGREGGGDRRPLAGNRALLLRFQG